MVFLIFYDAANNDKNDRRVNQFGEGPGVVSDEQVWVDDGAVVTAFNALHFNADDVFVVLIWQNFAVSANFLKNLAIF